MIAAKNTHGYDGKFDLKTRQVESPYRGKDGEKQSEIVPFNTRESSASSLGLKEAQTRAYNHFWELAYNAGHSRQMAIDPSVEPVDTSGISDPIPAGSLDAATALGRIKNEPDDNKYPGIGKDNYTLIWMTCVMSLTLKDLAEIQHGPGATRSQRDVLGFAIKVAYKELAVYFGYIGKGQFWTRLQNFMEADARPTDRQDLREVE